MRDVTEGIPIMKLAIAAAALIAAAAFFTAPAGADYIGAGPLHQNGKCWKDTGGSRDSRYGTWIDCPNFKDDCSKGQLAFEKLHKGHEFFDECRGGRAEASKTNAAAKVAATGQKGAR